MNLMYNLTGVPNSYEYRFDYYTDVADMEAAAELIRTDFMSHLAMEKMPYSFLLVDSILVDEWGDGEWEANDCLSNTYCMAVATGDVRNLNEEQRYALSHNILKTLVDDAVGDLNWDDYQGLFYEVVPDEVADGNLGDLIPGWDRTQMEALYELGYITYIEDWYDEYYYDTPPMSDWDDFFDLVMDTSWEDIEAQYGQYDRIMQKCEHVRRSILAVGYIF